MTLSPSQKIRSLLMLPKTVEDMDPQELAAKIVEDCQELMAYVDQPDSEFVTARMFEIEKMSQRLDSIRA